MSGADRRCDWQVIWDIRDAEGLDGLEKIFLMVVESRGVMKTTWQQAAKNMGMSKSTFFRVREQLVGKGLLLAVERPHRVTWYTVVRDAIHARVPDNSEELGELRLAKIHSQTETGRSRRGNGHSQTETGHSHQPEQKGNKKGNKKSTTRARAALRVVDGGVN